MMKVNTSLVAFALLLTFCAHVKFITGDQAKMPSEIAQLYKISDINALVSKTFSDDSQIKKEEDKSSTNTEHKPSKTYQSTFQLILKTLQLLGVDTSKMQAIAINGLIFMPQMVWQYLAPNMRPNEMKTEAKQRPLRKGSPMNWLLLDKKSTIETFQDLTYDRNILNNLIESLPQGKVNIECIKLLLCKTSPFVTAIQDFMSKKTSIHKNADKDDESNGFNTFFSVFSLIENYQRQDKMCVDKYDECMII